MQTVCPECHTLHEFKKPLNDYTVTCEKCKTVFLSPIEALPDTIQSREDLEASINELEDAFTAEKRRLDDRLEKQHKDARRQIEQKFEKTETEIKKKAEANEAKSVKDPIAIKLLKIVLSIYFVAVITVNAIHMINQYYNTKALILADLESSEKIFGKGLSEAIWNMDENGVQAIIAGMLEHPVIVGIKIVDIDGEMIGTKGIFIDNDGKGAFASRDNEPVYLDKKKMNTTGLFWHSFPITYSSDEGEKTITGEATVYSDRKFIFERVKTGYWLLAINAMAVAIVLWITLSWVSRIFLGRPLSMLTNAVASLNMENMDSLEVRVNTTDRNELKILEESFNKMVQNLIEEKKTILQMSSTFEKFIPKQFLSRIAEEGINSIQLGGMGSERLSILYARIQSFDDISRGMDSNKQFQFLNSYLSSMEVPIERHGGFIFQLNKKAIMALFTLDDHSMEALSAVYAAIDMQKALVDFNENQQQLGHPTISIGIGVHSGNIVLGTLGNEKRLESTAIGDSIEAAIHLQELTDNYNSQFLISHNTFSLLESFDAFQWRELDFVQMGSKAEPARIYEVFDADPAIEIKQQILDSYQKGMESFQNQNWDESIRHFENCLSVYPVDIVSQMYIKRSQGYKTDDAGIVDFLHSKSEMFRSLDDISVAELAQHFGKVHFNKGENILEYGEIGKIFYIVRSGNLEVILPEDTGKGVSAATLEKGDCFGEMSLMTDEPIMATIKGVTPGELLILNQEQFESMLRKYSTLNNYFHKLFLKRLVDNKNSEG